MGDRGQAHAAAPLPPGRLLLVVTVFWTYVSASTVAQWELLRQAIPRTPALAPEIYALEHVLLFPLLYALTLLSVRIGYTVRRLPLHVLLAALFGLCARPALIAARALVDDLTLAATLERMDSESTVVALKLYASAAVYGAMNFLVLQGIVAGIVWYARYRREQALRADLALQFERARLNALRMQLSPHFLYNTLSAIAGLVRPNPNAAEQMVTRLGDLFHRVLTERDEELVTLEQELEYAESYLEIQRIRFEERLTYEIDVEPALRNLTVPPLLLQPLLENAVEHGLAASEGAVHVRVVGRTRGERAELVVTNAGAGITGANALSPVRHGVGLRNVRERLTAAYAGRAELSFRKSDASEFESLVSIPRDARSAA